MADRFDKFTEQARRVLTLAQEEAQRFNHNFIGTEHLLLGLTREEDGVAARVLDNLGVQLPAVRSAVEFIIGRGESIIMGQIGLTPRSKKVIELAVDEARRLKHYSSGGGEDGYEWRFTYRFTPALDPAARRLGLELAENRWLMGTVAQAEEVRAGRTGPWTFTVALPSGEAGDAREQAAEG